MNQDPQTQQLQFNALERGAFPGLPEAADVSEAHALYQGVEAIVRGLNREAQEKHMSPLSSDKGQVPGIARKAQLLRSTASTLLIHALENWPVKDKDTSNYTHGE